MKRVWTKRLAMLLMCLLCLTVWAAAEEIPEETAPIAEPAEIAVIPEAEAPAEEAPVEVELAETDEPMEAVEPEAPAPEEPAEDPEEHEPVVAPEEPEAPEAPEATEAPEAVEEEPAPETDSEENIVLIPELKLDNNKKERVELSAETPNAVYSVKVSRDMTLALRAEGFPVTMKLTNQRTGEETLFKPTPEEKRAGVLEITVALRRGEYLLTIEAMEPGSEGLCLLSAAEAVDEGELIPEEELIPDEEIIPVEVALSEAETGEESLEIEDYDTPLGLDPDEIGVTLIAAYGEDASVTLTAVVTGCDPALVTVDWQYSPDGGVTVYTVEDAHGLAYAYTVNDNNRDYLWRAVVTRVGESEAE